MRLKLKNFKFLAGKPVCMIHKDTAKELGLHLGDRVSIKGKNRKIISIGDIISGTSNKNEIAVSGEIFSYLKLKKGSIVDVELAPTPHSIELIRKKLNGFRLKENEIKEIIKDISNNALRESEIAFFISGVYENEMSLEETKNLVNAIVKTGGRLKLRGKVVDKHCIGGVAGNRTTPIIVSICAATGLIIPKTSSRAITSAAGTADVIETLAKVDFSVNDIKKIIKKTNSCFVWGGALGLAPADDKIIRIERAIKIDSTAQLVASILSKKISVDSEYILIDIPYGKSAKVNKNQAEKLKSRFLDLSGKFDLKLKVVLTDGSEPIGNGIGPVLEMRDVIKVLKRTDSPKDLEERSLMLSGRLLELAGKARKGEGEQLAKKILDSGKAFKKFEQIIKVQEGEVKKLVVGKYSYSVRVKKKRRIKHINNKLINSLARFDDKKAGIYLYKKKNQTLKKSEKIFTIYAESKEKLEHAKKFYNKNKKYVVEFY